MNPVCSKWLALCALVICLFSPRALSSEVGSVWAEASTHDSITVDCKITQTEKFKATDVPTYEVCWRLESEWWKGVCNGGTSVVTTTMPYTITGLQPGTAYKIRVNVQCYKRKWSGGWGSLEFRNVNETKCKTTSTAPTLGTGTLTVVPTDTTLTATVTWTGSTGAAGPSWIRIGYKRTSNFFYDLDGTLRDASATLPGNWDPGNSVKGAVEITNPNVQATNSHTFTGLKPCRRYVVEAVVFTPDGTLTGKELARASLETTGDCGFGSFKTDLLSGDVGGIASGYEDATLALYSPGHVPSTHVVGALPLGGFVVAVDHTPGSSTMTLHTLSTEEPTSMPALASTSAPSAPGSTTVHVAPVGGGNHIIIMEDRWDVYGFQSVHQPQRLGGLVGPALGRDVASRGSTAYVSMGAAGLAIVDASNSTNPALASILPGVTDVQDAHVEGQRLFLAVSNGGVLAFDVTNALSPTSLGVYAPNYANGASALAADAAYVYVANDAGLEVIDAATMARIGVRAGISAVTQVATDGASAYLLGTMQDGPSPLSGILRLSVATPSAPQFVGSYSPHLGAGGGALRSLALDGDRIFVALEAGGCSVVDVESMVPAGETELGRWSPGTSPLLAHLATVDPVLEAAIVSAEGSGETSIGDDDLFGWLRGNLRASFDLWQIDSTLNTAGLDLETWLETQHPAAWMQYLDELGPVGSAGFNVDLGDAASVPPGNFSGAGLHAGVWNAVGAPWSAVLVDVNGRPATATASSSSGSAFVHDHAGTSDEEEQFLDDGQAIGSSGSTVTWSFSGLVPGNYRVTTGAWNPADAGAIVAVEVVDSPDGVKTCGGAWPDADVEGVTFVQHEVAVANGTLVLHATTQSGVGVLNGFQLQRLYPALPAEAYCFGDGSGPACPCSNSGLVGHGCDNSSGSGGALLTASGATDPDTVVLTCSGALSNALSIFLQGNASNPSGVAFGDGVRCVAGSLKRLYVKSAVGGTASAPAGGDASITERSAALGDPFEPGSVRYYQVYYRDPNPGFCPSPPGSTFNVSNGMSIQW